MLLKSVVIIFTYFENIPNWPADFCRRFVYEEPNILGHLPKVLFQ